MVFTPYDFFVSLFPIGIAVCFWILSKQMIRVRLIIMGMSKSFREITPPKSNMDAQNDGLKKVAPLKYGHLRGWIL